MDKAWQDGGSQAVRRDQGLYEEGKDKFFKMYFIDSICNL
jgi:hypothetical protein